MKAASDLQFKIIIYLLAILLHNSIILLVHLPIVIESIEYGIYVALFQVLQ